MELVTLSPLPGAAARVEGWLHSPITEMETHRERFPAVVLCPGGAYAMCSQREADPVAQQFFARGYNVFTLWYSVGEQAKGFLPLRELAETVALLRENAPQYRVDPGKIAVCGFSAGGHLAASLGVLWDDPTFLAAYGKPGDKIRPDAMVLCYPVILADRFAHVESLENVSGCKQGTPGYQYFSLERHVSPGTPPAFLWHTMEDDCVPVENSLRFLEALHQAGVPAEAHFFPQGGHGMSVCTGETGSPHPHNAQWVGLCLNWLDDTLGFRL